MIKAGSRRPVLRAAAAVAIVFGLLTVLSGGTALFGRPEVPAAVGDAVPFVLWFNFFAGFAYIAAGGGLLARQRWAAWLSAAIFLATAFVFAAFGFHVIRGGAYELRTVGAMTLRSVIWLAITAIAIRETKPMARKS